MLKNFLFCTIIIFFSIIPSLQLAYQFQIFQEMLLVMFSKKQILSLGHALPCRSSCSSSTAPGTVALSRFLLKSALTKCRRPRGYKGRRCKAKWLLVSKEFGAFAFLFCTVKNVTRVLEYLVLSVIVHGTPKKGCCYTTK